MGLENCQIYLDNPTATYSPGDTVSGRAEINLSSAKKVRGIEISYKGQAHTYWTESESYTDSKGKSHRRSVSYSADEQYFNIKYFLIGGPNNDSIELAPGQLVYAFSYILPTVLPSSFEGQTGYVRYTIKVTLVRPWKFDQTIKAAYTVVDHLDLNLRPQCREPATLSMEKYFCCLFCKSGPMTGVLNVPCTGFVSGQSIPITLEIDNVSDVQVSGVKIKLRKIVTFHSRPGRKTKVDRVKIAEISSGIPVAGKHSASNNYSITIPSLPASNLQNCSIIDIHYELEVEIGVDGMHKSMYGNLPITIGTIPFANMIAMHGPIMSSHVGSVGLHQQPILGWIPAPPNTPPADLAMMPPPSYEECQFGTKSILDDGDSKHTLFNNSANWAPSYPVYHYGTTQSDAFGSPSRFTPATAPPKE